MEKQANEIKIKVEIEVTVDPFWIEFCTKYNDMFMQEYCGYWIQGIARTDEFGWLCYEFEDDAYLLGQNNSIYKAGIKAWENGEPLPNNFHRMDKDMAIKAWKFGVEKWGVDWYENSDAHSYDYVMQMAMLGELRYA